MSGERNGKGVFVIKVMSTENATWQGSATWVEENKVQYFRSALELMKMIDQALENHREIGGVSHEV